MRKWLFICCLGLPAVLLACGIGPTEPTPLCLPCAQGACETGFRCVNDICVAEQVGGCIPDPDNSATIRILNRPNPVPIVGCSEGHLLRCLSDDKPCMVGETKCDRGVLRKCADWKALDPRKLPGDSCLGEKEGCSGEGVWRCVVGAARDELRCEVTSAAKPQEERCNGIDDDCDGEIDELIKSTCYTGPPGTGDTGACRSGTQICDNGKFGICRGEALPSPEKCDGIDNNCNGQVDESLDRTCYSGPNNTQGVGPCKAGMQRCVGGRWSECKGQVYPIGSQVCAPQLSHTIKTSLLSCKATAQHRACAPDGSCVIGGEQKSDESRKTDLDLFVRCRGSNFKECGVFAAEGVARREVEVLSADKGSIRLTIAGSGGSCACNGWCGKGCTDGPGCCQWCNISAQECNAGANYLAYHRLAWKSSLPLNFSLVLEVEKLEGGEPQFALVEGTSPTQHFKLTPKQKCLLVLPSDSSKGQDVLITNHSTLTCANADDFSIILVLRPATPADASLAPCAAP